MVALTLKEEAMLRRTARTKIDGAGVCFSIFVFFRRLWQQRKRSETGRCLFGMEFGWSVQFYAENFEGQGTESWMGDGGWRLDGGGVNFVCGAFNRFVVRFTVLPFYKFVV